MTQRSLIFPTLMEAKILGDFL